MSAPIDDVDIAAIRATLASLPAAPWQWFGNALTREVYLATVHDGRVIIMDFERWGMGGAQPRFQIALDGEPGNGVMRKLVDLPPALGPQMVGSHRNDFVGIGHPAARFMAESPALVDRLLAEIDRLRTMVESYRQHLEILSRKP